MPATIQLEILEGKLADSTGTTNARPSTPTPSHPDREAGGHQNTVRIMRCQSCGALSYIEYDPAQAQEYNCSHCNVGNLV